MCWKREKENERKERKTTQEELRRRRTRQLKQNKSTPNKNKKERAILAWERNQECFAQRRGRLQEKKLFLFLLFANGLHFNWVEVPPAKKGGRGRKKRHRKRECAIKVRFTMKGGRKRRRRCVGVIENWTFRRNDASHFAETSNMKLWQRTHAHARMTMRVWFVCVRVVGRANRERERVTLKRKSYRRFDPLGTRSSWRCVGAAELVWLV